MLAIILIDPSRTRAQVSVGSIQGNVSIENLNLDIGSLNIPIHLPPTAWASLAIGAASLLMSESQNAQINGRLDRIDAKLAQILAQITEINQKLDTISAKLTYISERLTELQNVVERQAPRAASMQVAGQLATIRASMPDYQASPRKKRDEMDRALQELRRLTNTLMQYDEPDYFLTVGAAMLVERDLAILTAESNLTMSRELDGFVRYFRRISEAAGNGNTDAAIASTDSFPLREAKYRRQLQVLMPLTKTSAPPIWTGTTTSADRVCQYDRYFPNPEWSPRRLYQYAFPLAANEFVLPLSHVGEINVCYRPIAGAVLLQYNGNPVRNGDVALTTNANFVLHGYFWIEAGVTVDQQNGRFAATAPFYHPSNINDCYGSCTSACKPSQPWASNVGDQLGVTCGYGISAAAPVDMQGYAQGMSPVMPDHRQHIGALQTRMETANRLLNVIHESRASAAAAKDLLASAQKVRQDFVGTKARL